MSTIYILFALYTLSNGGSSDYTQEFGSQGACEMALAEGIRKNVFDRGFCTPKG
ncbi:hypothetical protein [Escherichia phage phiWec179]|nr:hypothetical protein [Escherichia phage phiWec179]BDU12559.1 hypothetical protein [Escherichia phage phiWec181]BDU12704.1 hypothetical protein [Escherichia phage phiWec186]